MPGKDLNYRQYWERRYRAGGTSGAGSYGDHAAYKASIVNAYLRTYDIRTVLDFGCGDGNQLGYMDYRDYVGLDVSKAAVKECRRKYLHDSSKRFRTYDPRKRLNEGAFDLTVSLEVLMHVVDEKDFVATLDAMFAHAAKLVIIQAPLFELVSYQPGSTERHRRIEPYLAKYDFDIVDTIIHPSVTREQRERGEIGEMLSDFIVLTPRHPNA